MTKQIPQEYKQTKVGVIPEDWKVMKLKHFIDELEAGVSVNSIDEPCIDDEYGVLKTSSLSNGKFIYTENKKIKQSELVKARLNPIEGNLLISRMNTPDLVGAIGLVNKTHLNLFLPDRLWQTKFSSRQEVNSCWLNSLLNTKQYKLIVRSLATGTSDSMKNISKKSFLEIEIPFPPIKEQKKIAEILSTWDDAIAKQEQLIEQKQVLKKGIMQQIFSQKIRFKDDNGNDYPVWKEKSLGMIGNTYSGLSGKTKDDFGIGSPYITYKQIFDSITIDIDKFEYVNINENEKQSTVKYGDAFFTTSSETPNEVGMSSLYLSNIETSIYLNSFCFGYRFNHNILFPKFASYLFRNQNFRSKVMELAQGSTRFNISKSQMMKITDYFPRIGEQIKIADFLTSIDDEITKQTQILDQLKLQKQSLMQKLLTGRVRTFNYSKESA